MTKTKLLDYLVFITLVIMVVLPFMWSPQSEVPESKTNINKIFSEKEIETFAYLNLFFLKKTFFPGISLTKK